MPLDTTSITHYDRNDHDLEEFLLLCVVVAGKVAHIQERKLRAFLLGAKSLAHHVISSYAPKGTPMPKTPFGWLRAIAQYSTAKDKDIRIMLENNKLSPYLKLHHLFAELPKAELDLRTCTVQQLCAFKGIGPKTARMFLVHSRRDAQHAVLDVHILRYLREELKLPRVPKNTPGDGPSYLRLEAEFLKHATAIGKSPAELDTEIWLRYSQRGPQ